MPNISPIPPINNLGGLGGGVPPMSSRPGGFTPASGKKLGSVFDKIDVDQIGKGSRLKEGSYEKQFGRSREYGLKGQLGTLQWSGRRGVTKNLSDRNVEQIHDLIEGRLKKKTFYGASSFNKWDQRAIRKESMKLVKTKDSGFTREDRKDLLKVVETMKQEYRDRALHRAENSGLPVAGQPLAGLGGRVAPVQPAGAFQPGATANNNLWPQLDLTHPPTTLAAGSAADDTAENDDETIIMIE